MLIQLYQLRSISRLSLRPKRKSSRDSTTAGSRTRRDSATNEDEGTLTRQSSRSSISGRSSVASGRSFFYRLKPLERAGSSTRSFYHFMGSQEEVDAESSSAGHTPFLPKSLSAGNTPMATPGVELEEMSWETRTVPRPIQPRLQSAQRSILKLKRSMQELESSSKKDSLEQRHGIPCESCKQPMGSALAPSVSLDAAMSELVARLQAAEIAAEVETDAVFPNRQERVLGQICRGRPKESDDGSEGFSENTLDEPSRRSADHKAIVPLPRGHPQRCQEHASTHADTNDECIDWGRSNDAFGNNPDRCTKSPSPQAEASCAERESPLGLDGVLEETKDHEPRAVERQSSKVANRIREYELKNAIPMPRHFRPSGHTRHDHDNRAHQSQLYREEKPEVDLIFPLHVRRFPRRISDGTPFRPETPLHRSIPDEEPYIHAPQPARSMPMLKDPPEHDPPPLAAPEVLGTPRGNHDGLAIASGYGHRASRNFAVRRNSRP
jgi:hypothetical protein